MRRSHCQQFQPQKFKANVDNIGTHFVTKGNDNKIKSLTEFHQEVNKRISQRRVLDKLIKSPLAQINFDLVNFHLKPNRDQFLLSQLKNYGLLLVQSLVENAMDDFRSFRTRNVWLRDGVVQHFPSQSFFHLLSGRNE
jgi:hypothetical protein